MVQVKTSVHLNPWQTPNFATVIIPPGKREDGIRPAPTIAVADLDAEALDELAREWLNELYLKAKKPCPFSWASSEK